MTQLSASPKPHPRIAVDQPAILEHASGEQLACTVIDVSQEGFRLKVPRVLAPGADYTLHLADEAHRIEIRWAAPNEVGGLFIEKLG